MLLKSDVSDDGTERLCDQELCCVKALGEAHHEKTEGLQHFKKGLMKFPIYSKTAKKQGFVTGQV